MAWWEIPDMTTADIWQGIGPAIVGGVVAGVVAAGVAVWVTRRQIGADRKLRDEEHRAAVHRALSLAQDRLVHASTPGLGTPAELVEAGRALDSACAEIHVVCYADEELRDFARWFPLAMWQAYYARRTAEVTEQQWADYVGPLLRQLVARVRDPEAPLPTRREWPHETNFVRPPPLERRDP